MRILFKGFGLNLATTVLVLIVASILAGAFTLVRPAIPFTIDGQADDRVTSSATYPCVPHGWRYRDVVNRHGGPGWEVTVRAKIRYNGCDVMVVPGSQHCSHWAIGYSIGYNWCGNYRLSTATAYGERLIVGARFQVYVAWSGFPISAAVHMCQQYDRRGVLTREWDGPWGTSC